MSLGYAGLNLNLKYLKDPGKVSGTFEALKCALRVARHCLSVEQFPVSAYARSLKNLKGGSQGQDGQVPNTHRADLKLRTRTGLGPYGGISPRSTGPP